MKDYWNYYTMADFAWWCHEDECGDCKWCEQFKQFLKEKEINYYQE